MKTLTRAIGTVVLVLAVGFFALVKVNEKGVISGNLSAWVFSTSEHLTAIWDNTLFFLKAEGYVAPKSTEPTPTAEPQVQTPVPEVQYFTPTQSPDLTLPPQ